MDVSTRMRSACPYPLLCTARGASASGGSQASKLASASMQPGHGSDGNRCKYGPCASRLRGEREQAAAHQSSQGGCEFRLSLKARPRHASLPRDLIDAASASASRRRIWTRNPLPADAPCPLLEAPSPLGPRCSCRPIPSRRISMCALPGLGLFETWDSSARAK